MANSFFSSQSAFYESYIQEVVPGFSRDSLPSSLTECLEKTNWEEPKTALDLNNFAVIALIEAELSQDPSVREFNLNLAIEALSEGIKREDHWLCAAHLSLAYILIGDRQTATQIALTYFVKVSALTTTDASQHLPGIIYLPQQGRNLTLIAKEQLLQLLTANNSIEQVRLFYPTILCQAQLVFYNATGKRFLQLALQINSNSLAFNRQLGLANLLNQQLEGIFYLHRARQLSPNCPTTLQVLYLAYRQFQKGTAAGFWQAMGINSHSQFPQTLDWAWAELDEKSAYTYIPFDGNLLLATEPHLRSIVTTVLLGQGDWFESEMEFWRHQLQPGMTVIDVGANVGVYTFSAANCVGPSGQVLAIEPFPGCISCLEETCRVNTLPQVKICAGAASDRNGTVGLAVGTASELNQVVSGTVVGHPNRVEVPAFTLDSLAQQYQLEGLDWLKLDAEGHELQVLAGSEELLSAFKPKILYENIAGIQSSNIPVANFLWSRGYNLYFYMPYIQKLQLIHEVAALDGHLNIIALPKEAS